MFLPPSGPPPQADFAWEVATLFPIQGDWSEKEYLHLTDGTNRLIELTDGKLEFLPMATEAHQELLEFFYLALRSFIVNRKLGKVHTSGLRVRVRPDKIRQPDVLFLHRDNFHVRHNRVWDGADLVMEVVNDDPKDRQRDYETKLADYAEARIPEYWIVDPEERRVWVYTLAENAYALHGQFDPEQVATSVLLPEFSINVAEVFATLDDIPE